MPPSRFLAAVVVLAGLASLARGQEQVAAPQALPGTFTLDRVTGLTLANSPVLRQAQARVQQAQGLAIQAGLYPNPQQNSGNPNQLGGNNSLYSAGITQEVVRANKIGLNQGAAEQAVRQAGLDYVRQRFEVLTAVRQQFYTLLATQRRLEMLRNILRVTQRSVEISTKLRDAEQANEADVLLLRMESNRIEVALRAAEYARTASARQLSAQIGLPNLVIDRVDGSLSTPLPDFDNPQELQFLLSRSSLVESARTDIARTQILLRRAEVEPIPNLILNGGYQWTVNQPHTQALVGMYFTIPIWDRNQGNIRAASANVQNSVAQLSSVQNDLTRQLAEAIGRYRGAARTVEIYDTSIVPDATKSLQLGERSLAAGQLDLLRLLQTQRLVYESNLDYINALQERLVSAAAIAGILQLEQFP
jgi:cobalt-zinc-cadmium efflux system outer membrane protein